MRISIAKRLADGILLLKLSDNFFYSQKELSLATGVSVKTINRNKTLIALLDFTLQEGGYYE